MLESRYVGDNFQMFMTVLGILVTNIPYLFALASGTNIKKMSTASKLSKIVTNLKSPTPRCHQFFANMLHPDKNSRNYLLVAIAEKKLLSNVVITESVE